MDSTMQEGVADVFIKFYTSLMCTITEVKRLDLGLCLKRLKNM